MEVHQSLPAQYLHNPYMVKTEQPPSAPSTPPNEDSNRTVTQQRRPANGPVVSLSSCSADHRLYGQNNISAVQSLSPRNTQNVVSLSSCSADHRLYGQNNISAVQSLSPRNTQNVVSLSSCSADHRLYGQNNISAVQSLSPRNTQNGILRNHKN
uniref:GLI3 n=1 Tax=Ascaris lumbricoides TaxID=6252 RepID=A0A0M3HZP0_ASCLU